MNKLPASNRLSSAISDEAARWIADGLDEGLTEEAELARDVWLAADPRHVQAYDEMRVIWAQLDYVPIHVETPQHPLKTSWRRRWPVARKQGKSRSKLSVVGTAMAASLLLMLLPLSGDWVNQWRADYATGTGETRLIGLADGSTVHLDTRSAIQVDYQPNQRTIRLLQGKALFQVASNPKRPFTVLSNEGSATALGTAFLVAEEGGGTLVTVTEHQVRVDYKVDGPHNAVLNEGYAIRYDRRKGLGDIQVSNSVNATAWTDGALVFNDAPLDDVIQAIGRYHSGTIHAFGKARDIRVSGVFRVDNPVLAVAQLEQSVGVKVRRLTDYFIFISS